MRHTSSSAPEDQRLWADSLCGGSVGIDGSEVCTVSNVVRWMVALVIAAHGLIHFLGTAKGLGWAEVAALRQPIGTWGGLLWSTAGVLVLAAAALLVARSSTWWWPAAAAVVSQVAILTSWQDARAGTAANILLLLVAGYLRLEVARGGGAVQAGSSSAAGTHSSTSAVRPARSSAP